jgi:hypothetical protein
MNNLIHSENSVATVRTVYDRTSRLALPFSFRSSKVIQFFITLNQCAGQFVIEGLDSADIIVTDLTKTIKNRLCWKKCKFSTVIIYIYVLLGKNLAAQEVILFP